MIHSFPLRLFGPPYCDPSARGARYLCRGQIGILRPPLCVFGACYCVSSIPPITCSATPPFACIWCVVAVAGTVGYPAVVLRWYGTSYCVDASGPIAFFRVVLAPVDSRWLMADRNSVPPISFSRCVHCATSMGSYCVYAMPPHCMYWVCVLDMAGGDDTWGSQLLLLRLHGSPLGVYASDPIVPPPVVLASVDGRLQMADGRWQVELSALPFACL